jgi:fructokinase
MAFRVVGIGEILWDLLPSGKQLGGAPANFACHAHAIGAESCLISRVGDDDLGREVLQRLADLGMPTETIGIDPERPTGTVAVELSDDGQPKFTIHSNSAWDCLEATYAALEAVRECHAICFGTLAQREQQSRQVIAELINAAPLAALRVCDINLRAPFFSQEVIESSLHMADVLKLNDAELPTLASMLQLRETATAGQLAELAERYSLGLVALTRGDRGSLLWSAGRCSEHAGVSVDVVDAVGAGDAFTAAMTMGYLRGLDLDRINEQANRIAAFVCTQPGATPRLPLELRNC